MDGFFFKTNKQKQKMIQAEQIQEWKDKYGGAYKLPVDDKTAYLREPKMKDFKRAFAAMQNDGDIAFGEALLNALFIGGDEEVKTVDDYFNPARKKLIKFFDYEDAEIERKKNQFIITIGDARCTVRVVTREDLKIAERKNPSGKVFVTQEKLFERILVSGDDVFNDRDNADIRFPLYKAIEEIQNQKIATLEKL